MKKIKTLAALVVLGLGISGFAIAQSFHGGAGGHHTMQHHTDPAAATEHLTEAYALFTPFDANKDGQLDAAEKESLAKAIAEGTVQLPAHTPPNRVMPSGAMMVNHIADMYAYLVRHDANHDGVLDSTEQAALKIAIEKGELDFLHPRH